MTLRRRLAILLAILLVAATLDCVGLSWGLPYLWHTDEKPYIAARMIRDRSFNPHYFINPALHTYVIAGVMKATYAWYPGQAFQDSFTRVTQMTWRGDPGRPLQLLCVQAARGVSVVFGLGCVLLLWVIGRRWVDEATGLLAAAFLAVTMGMASQAHYATVESLFFFLLLLSLWRLEAVATDGRLRDYLWAGAAIGLACTTKYTGALLALPFAAAHLTRYGRRSLGLGALGRILALGGVAAVAFFAGTPYAIIDWRGFWVDGVIFSWQTGAPGNSLIHQPRSYLPYLSLLANAMGWPLFVLSLAGLGLAAWALFQHDGSRVSLPRVGVHVAWIVGSFVILGASPHHAFRFIMPIVPSLIVLAAVAAMTAIRRAPRPAWRTSAVALVAAVIVYSGAYTARSDYMMLHDTRYAAGEWLGQHKLGPDDTVATFALFPYLPYFDRPSYRFRYDASVLSGEQGADFWATVEASLARSRFVYVDSSFFYDRYFEYLAYQADRAEMYRRLLKGDGIASYRLVERFTWTNPWWLDPRPERVSPEIDVFAKPGMITDREHVRPFRRL